MPSTFSPSLYPLFLKTLSSTASFHTITSHTWSPSILFIPSTFSSFNSNHIVCFTSPIHSNDYFLHHLHSHCFFIHSIYSFSVLTNVNYHCKKKLRIKKHSFDRDLIVFSDYVSSVLRRTRSLVLRDAHGWG